MRVQRAIAFLDAYSSEDVYLVKVFGSSASIWEISNPSMFQLCQDLVNPNTTMAVTFAVSFSRSVIAHCTHMLCDLSVICG